MPATPQSNSGIVTDDQGQRHIPESKRADGSTRKAIKIRPGYRPPEDVELYKNQAAEAFRGRGKSGVPGAEGVKGADQPAATPAASNKNAKRREARRKAKAAAEEGQNEDGDAGTEEGGLPTAAADAPPADDGESKEAAPTVVEVDPELEKKKKVRNLKKKLDQARALRVKEEGGQALLPEQIAKVIKISELITELAALGFDANAAEPAKDDQDQPQPAAS